MSDRTQQLEHFAAHALAHMARQRTKPAESITGDASFRRFSRLFTDRGSLVLVDAPPATENNAQYLRIATHWRSAGLPLPEIYADDLERGFFIVEDFGDRLFAQALQSADAAGVDALYGDAIALLLRIQALPDDGTCPPYEDSRLRMELGIFREWFLGAALNYELDASEAALLTATEEALLANISTQPRCCVHRDWHSRNLLVRADGSLGIIDFQDALYGPYVYDLVSLLRDCYVRWPDERVVAWQQQYLVHVPAALRQRSDFTVDFDLTGMQRHLKAVGIFARLWKRDGRTGYLDDIPRVLGYLRDVAANHSALARFSEWLATRIEPAWQRARPNA